MFAIISHNKGQYKVEPGKTYRIDSQGETEDKKMKFDEVLLVSDDKTVKVGDPTIKGATVEAEILGEVRDKKVGILKFHAKKHYKRYNGHRQQYTEIKISSIKS
ncbi:50S ribosomal protein L21 [Candidatus Berkelbacteria bacterium CG10_big_fil_rev_8_21_14_0_10_43_13]|uniref:Large ribosomal subunit protein bL21 n=1 Tax=Candidatus Berkelbacteria bacterium CG10_big_fil_rev_8_21_14_0_10_43_13 TaxID=1974514 RepID=A0A2H0W734_9BACT|nr:MAG: 50S ribosomal protein L21 [Candidatus Berkelbacteria bacterium CG10_big_fil_rev_8_21_14_0_10_43_13]